jgi:DNA-binding transcriptional MocR family regulator
VTPASSRAAGRRASRCPADSGIPRGQLSPRFDPALPDGPARAGCVSAKDLGAAGRALRARHAAVGHGASFRLTAAALRAEIAAYLQVSRGIDCAPSQVFVTSGYRHTMS